MLLTIFIFPLLAAIGVFALGEKLAKPLAIFASAILFGLTCVLFFAGSSTGSFGEVKLAWIPDMNIHFHLLADGLSVWLLLLTNFLVPIIILSSYHKAIRNANVFFALVLFMQFGLNGVFLAADGFLYYIFWELALLPIYFIVWLWSENENLEVRKRTAFKFFVYTIVGSLFMLFGFMYIYAQLGTVSLEALYSSSFSSTEQIGLFLCFFLAFAVKIPIFPFHTWQADTYREAPSVGTMLLSGIMLKMGIYSLIRWLVPVFPLGLDFWTPYIIVLCVIGIIYGAIIAIKQDNIKNLLAFSSLSHVGLIAAGTFVLTFEGMEGAVIQMLAHGVNVVGLFFVAEIILQRTGTLSISQLGGIRTVAPRFFTFTIILVLAAVALPTTNAFVGEFLLLYSLFQYHTWLGVFGGLTIILAAVYLFRMVQYTFLGNVSQRTQNFADLSNTETAIFTIITLVIFGFGLFPNIVFKTALPVLETILQTAMR